MLSDTLDAHEQRKDHVKLTGYGAICKPRREVSGEKQNLPIP